MVENTHKSFEQTEGATACGGPPISPIPSCASPDFGSASHPSRVSDSCRRLGTLTRAIRPPMFDHEIAQANLSHLGRVAQSAAMSHVSQGVDKIGEHERHENSRAKVVTQHSHKQHPDDDGSSPSGSARQIRLQPQRGAARPTTGGAQFSQSDAARGPTTPPRPVIGHRQGPPSRRARGLRHG